MTVLIGYLGSAKLVHTLSLELVKEACMPSLEEEVKEDVVDQLPWDDRLDASKIEVTVDGAAVVLTGTVPPPASPRRRTRE